MKKGVDYTGITVSFFCHDGKGNYVMHKRGDNCRDEQGRWDFGGGGLKFGEGLVDGVKREVQEEYGACPVEIDFLDHNELHREHDGAPTHWVQFLYRVLVNRDEVVNNEPDKHQEMQWVRLDNLPTPLHSQLQNLLEKHKAKL